jgi:hypothetical protein
MVLAGGLGHGFGFAPIVLADIMPPDMEPPDIEPPDMEFPDIVLPAMALAFAQCTAVWGAPPIILPDIAPPDIVLSANAGALINMAAAPIRIKRDMQSSQKDRA